jgi:hypothetical protein
MATGQGTITFDLGSAPGTNVVTASVSDASIGATSKVEIYIMGTDTTATHNAIEHQLLALAGLSLMPIAITASTGFTAQFASLLRLSGTFKARYIWAD